MNWYKINTCLPFHNRQKPGSFCKTGQPQKIHFHPVLFISKCNLHSSHNSRELENSMNRYKRMQITLKSLYYKTFPSVVVEYSVVYVFNQKANVIYPQGSTKYFTVRLSFHHLDTIHCCGVRME